METRLDEETVKDFSGLIDVNNENTSEENDTDPIVDLNLNPDGIL